MKRLIVDGEAPLREAFLAAKAAVPSARVGAITCAEVSAESESGIVEARLQNDLNALTNSGARQGGNESDVLVVIGLKVLSESSLVFTIVVGIF